MFASQDAVYHWNSVGTLRGTLSPWLSLTTDIYPTGLSSVWWRYIIYVWCGRYSLRNGTYISRTSLLQLGLMWIWSNKFCHRVPRDNLQMVLAAWNLSLLSFSFFSPPIHPLPLGCVWLPGHDLWFHLPFLLLCKAKLKIDEQGGLRRGALKEKKRPPSLESLLSKLVSF